MAEKKLSRNDCEKRIWSHIVEIQKLYRRYNPNGAYLSMTIIDGHISTNNDYWDKDKDRPLDFFVIDGEMSHII